ncbi:MAG: uracil-DNA glycosylase [Pseudonocardiales bacterium]|nr:uracil-DNA glycosylase [Pseudonocardiales bacterium]
MATRRVGHHCLVVAAPPDTTDLRELASAAERCRACDLYANATQTVFGDGPADARVLLVGEQPGDVEDQRGEPFVGPAGKLLDKALADAGITRDQAYLTNAVKHFSFAARGKRRIHETPRARHVTACRPWLMAEVASIRPRLIICLGAIATSSVFGSDVRVLRDRGALMERDSNVGRSTFLVTVHPSAILRAGERRAAEYDAFVKDLSIAASAVTER